MNSEEIKATIERLRSQYDKGFGHSLDDVACAFLGESYGMSVALSSKFRDALIALLKQADPDTHMELPMDADGEPIHIGDELEGSASVTEGERGTVHGFERNVKGAYEWIDASHVRHACKWWRHYQKPTVESVLYECCSEYHNAMIMGTCDIPCDVPALSEVINKHAAKMRELMSDDK